MKIAIMVVAVAVAALLLCLALVLFGLRWKITPVVDAVRHFNKRVTNRRVRRTAGDAASSTALIRHLGRTSGREYRTPVDVVAVDDTFLIALPYGRRADWLRNVLAAGSAIVVAGGAEIAVERPEVVPTADVAASLPRGTRITLSLFGVHDCLRVHRA